MKNITLDSTSFSEQLGVYDFMNVLLAGATFISGLSILNSSIYNALWNNMTFFKGLGIVLIIYISGLILQELGSFLDRKIFKTYKKMNRSILKGNPYSEYDAVASNYIIKNPLLLKQYRKYADKLLTGTECINDPKRFENEFVNNYFFSICQYYVSVKGKDKKVEKMRALFAMSKTLVACSALLSICALLSVLLPTGTTIELFVSSNMSNCGCANKIFFTIVFAVITFAFCMRTRRVMKNFLLILLGTYDAILLAEEETEQSGFGINNEDVNESV